MHIAIDAYVADYVDVHGPRERACDVDTCTAIEVPTPFSDKRNVTCADCHKFVCMRCTKHMTRTVSPGEEMPTMTIRRFTCPFCCAYFNQVFFH